MATQKYGDMLPKRQLGNTGMAVPILSLGGYGLGKVRADMTDEMAIETVRYALEQGLNYIDTSPMYFESERRIGIALADVKRENIVLSTKVGSEPQRSGDYSWDGTMWNIDNSIKRLGTDYFDLVLVHDPDTLTPDGLRPVLAPNGALEALEHLKAQGVVKAIGLGQRNLELHRIAIESGRFDVILTYRDYNPISQAALDTVLPLAEKNGVGVINGTVMMYGVLSGLSPEHFHQVKLHEWEYKRANRLYEFCQEKHIPVQAIAWGFCFRQELIDCNLTGARRIDQLKQNLEAAVFPISDAVWAEFEDLKLGEIF